MSTKALGRRRERPTRTLLAEPVGRIVVIEIDTRPAEIRDAYDAACVAREFERGADIIEAQTRERPVFPCHGVSVIRDHRAAVAVIEVRAESAGTRRERWPAV